MPRSNPSALLFFLTLCVSMTFDTQSRAEEYSVVELPTPLIRAAGLNARGDVVGDAGPGPSGFQFSGAFVYQHNTGEVTQLPCQGGLGCSAYAVGIDDAGDVVGTNFSLATRLTAIVWMATGGVTVFSDTFFFSTGSGINNHGQVVLTQTSMAGAQIGFITDLLDQSRTGLPLLLICPPPCEAQSSVNAINDRGHAVGWSQWGAQPPFEPGAPQQVSGIHAVLWINARATDLGALGDGTNASANGVNNLDEVVGNSTVGSASHAFLYREGRMTDLGNLAHDPGLNSDAEGINDRGEIVGWSDVRLPADGSIVQRAFVARDGRMSNLTSLIEPRGRLRGKLKLTEAVAINCNGWIAANGYDVATKASHAYLLLPRERHHFGCARHHERR